MRRTKELLAGLVSVLLFFFHGSPSAQTGNDVPYLKDVWSEWYVYDYERLLFVPYIDGVNDRVNKIHLLLDPVKYKGLYLKIENLQHPYLFFNSTLALDLSKSKNSRLFFPIDSLYSVWGTNPIVVTVYDAAKKIPPPLALIVSQGGSALLAPDETKDVSEPDPLKAGPEVFNDYQARKKKQDFISMFALMTLLAMGVYAANIAPIFNFVGMLSPLFSFYKSNLYSKKVDTVDLSLFFLMFSLGASFLITYFDSTMSSVALGYTGSDASSMAYWQRSLFWFAALLSLLSAKFLIMRIFNMFYESISIEALHWGEYMRIFQVYIVFWVVFVALSNAAFFWGGADWSSAAAPWAGIAYVVAVVFLCFRLIKQSSLINVFLFSYLCATELIPVLLLAKLFFYRN